LLLQCRNPFGRLRFRQRLIHRFARFVTERFQVRALRGGHRLVARRPLFGIFPRVTGRSGLRPTLVGMPRPRRPLVIHPAARLLL
jgi:hypothetical protein